MDAKKEAVSDAVQPTGDASVALAASAREAANGLNGHPGKVPAAGLAQTARRKRGRAALEGDMAGPAAPHATLAPRGLPPFGGLASAPMSSGHGQEAQGETLRAAAALLAGKGALPTAASALAPHAQGAGVLPPLMPAPGTVHAPPETMGQPAPVHASLTGPGTGTEPAPLAEALGRASLLSAVAVEAAQQAVAEQRAVQEAVDQHQRQEAVKASMAALAQSASMANSLLAPLGAEAPPVATTKPDMELAPSSSGHALDSTRHAVPQEAMAATPPYPPLALQISGVEPLPTTAAMMPAGPGPALESMLANELPLRRNPSLMQIEAELGDRLEATPPSLAPSAAHAAPPPVAWTKSDARLMSAVLTSAEPTPGTTMAPPLATLQSSLDVCGLPDLERHDALPPSSVEGVERAEPPPPPPHRAEPPAVAPTTAAAATPTPSTMLAPALDPPSPPPPLTFSASDARLLIAD